MDVGLDHPWIGAAGSPALGLGSVGADLGAGNTAENVRGL